MVGYVKKYGIIIVNIYVKEGLLEKVIFMVVKDIDVELVIIGIVGWVGLLVVLIGNMVEYVIDELDCDVLVVKFDGFVLLLVNKK